MATLPKEAPFLPDEMMIRAITDDFIRFHEARDIEKMLTLYTEDARIMVPFRPVAEGRKGLRQSFDVAFKEYDQKALKLETTFVETNNNAAFSIGTFQVNLKLPTGKRIDDQGKWLVALRRVGKTWKMVAHCWNTDLPIHKFTE